MMSTNRDVQILQPGNQIILYQLDATQILGWNDGVWYFHGHVHDGNITFGRNKYIAYPIEAEGFAKSSAGVLPTPRLRVANLDGAISRFCNLYQDLIGAKVTRIRTFSHYLDDGDEANPDNPVHMTPEIWIIEAKTREDKDSIEFELKASIDFNGKQLPSRQITPNICTWISKGGYKGKYCNYRGTAFFDKNGTRVNSETLDVCSGKVSHCRLRFEQGYTPSQPLNFGGFPAADSVRGYI